jgi:hypothetical protein
MSKLTPELIAELKAEHGEIYRLDAREYDKTIVIKKPDRHVYKRYRKDGTDEDKRHAALQQLVDDVIVWPPPDEFQAMTDDLPGLYETFGNQVARIAGLSREVDSKKL